jgi:hypothetical protein
VVGLAGFWGMKAVLSGMGGFNRLGQSRARWYFP